MLKKLKDAVWKVCSKPSTVQGGANCSLEVCILDILILKPELLPKGHFHFSIRKGCLATGSHRREFTETVTAKRKKNNKIRGVRNQALSLIEKAVYLYVMCINACKTPVFPSPFKKMPTWHLLPTQGLVTL